MNTWTNGLLVLSAAGIFQPAANAQEVQSRGSCFEHGQDIVVNFRGGPNPISTDWIGIYPTSNVDPSDDPLLWHWTCGSQHCDEPVSDGVVSFTANDNWISGWPLAVGTYRAVLAEDTPIEYVFLATTEEFRIVPDLQQCDNTDIVDMPLPPPISATPVTPSLVTTAPVASPSLQASSTPLPAAIAAPTTPLPASTTPMGQIIASAKNDIIALIQERPERRALYLRMIFHDCVGGACDGCINVDNMDNGGLGSSMGSLRDVERAYEGNLTRADIWALASFVGVEQAMPGIGEGDRIELPFHYYGREDCNDRLDRGPDPPLCSPNLGTDEVLDFFEQEFNFTPSETAAIMGGHTM
jgi:Peroxidase